MDSGDDPTLSPTVALIEQPAGFEFMPHFHRQNQFQVFVGGSGSLGRHALAPVVVHYAGAYTGYGPLLAGPEGIQYFTLRPGLHWQKAAIWLLLDLDIETEGRASGAATGSCSAPAPVARPGAAPHRRWAWSSTRANGWTAVTTRPCRPRWR